MKIKIVNTVDEERGGFQAGDVRDLPYQEALTLLNAGDAVPVAEKDTDKRETRMQPDRETRSR